MNVPAAEIEILSEEECLDLLRSHRVGRVAFTDHGQPLKAPHGDFRTWDDIDVWAETIAGQLPAPAADR